MRHGKPSIALGVLFIGGAVALVVLHHREPRRVSTEQNEFSFQSSHSPESTSITRASLDNKAPHELGSPKGGVSNPERQRDFYQATNLFPFVKRAALDAINNHDGRAAYYVSEALKACALVFRQAQQDPAFESNFDLEYAKLAPKAPDWARVKARRESDRCAQLAKADPFVELPARAEGYRKPAFWNEMAMAENDPLAEAHQAYMDVIGGNYTNQAGRMAMVKQAQEFVNDVARSGDPTALFLAGQLLSNGKASSDPLRGVGISLAACDLGYDCSANNPANSFHTCKESGGCPADADYAFYMQATLGPRDFATAFSNAQTFKELLAVRDWEGVRALVRLDGTVARN
jgi:hypothetical protein